MKNILITGSAGFVGHHAVEYILEKTDWNIIGIDSFRHRGDSERVNKNLRYQIFCHDLTSPVSQRTISKLPKIDYILMLASESHVDRSITDPVPFVENNIKVILNTLELCRKLKPQKIIQCSTDEVFGPAPEGYAHHEYDRILPSNPYAASKASQDAICFSYWRTYGMPIVITHCMNMIGERQDTEKFIPKVIKKVLNNETVHIHSDLKSNKIGSRMYIHAKNLTDAWLFILKNVDPILYNDGFNMMNKFNVVGELELNNLQVAKYIAQYANKELKYELIDFHSSRPGHDLRYALDGTLLKDLGWRPPIPLLDSLKQIVEWTIKNQEWIKEYE